MEIRKANPRGVVAVYIPEYVVGRWWEQLLHNQTALRLKGRLLFTPGVMVISVPYQLRSSEIAHASARSASSPGSAPATCAAVAPHAGEPRAAATRQRTSHGVRPASASGSRSSRPGRPRRPLRRSGSPGPSAASPPRSGVVVFVRHALPGERVVVEITEGTDGDRFWRGDAVEVLEASPDRVPAPCPYAGPGGCGGCDFQHVEPAAPARAQGRRGPRAAGPAGRPRGRDVEVEAVEPDAAAGARGCSTSTSPAVRRGLRKHRSHEVVPVDDCLIDRTGRPLATARRARREQVRRPARARFAVDRRRLLAGRTSAAPRVLVETRARGCCARSRGRGRWTSTPGSGCSRRSSPTRSGRRPGRGRRGRPARRRARRGQPRPGGRVAVDVRRVDRSLGASCPSRRPGRARPAPRGRQAPRWSSRRRPALAARGRATSPATRRRWPATWRSSPSTATRSRGLRAFDLFPMTHHVECVALLERT